MASLHFIQWGEDNKASTKDNGSSVPSSFMEEK